jgi:hypothetical protein
MVRWRPVPAPHIDHRHPFDDDVVEQVNLGLQEGGVVVIASLDQASRNALDGFTFAARRAGR